ncbi:HHE domain protein [Aspergillus aculeatinus CBS 121060]|uniref:HHE domain protein n=2 Tax=Aspergillus TaxID=5052 RepID=A0ACD1H8N0_9EURO|nr:HHE domain protein [Aspergillus aculeatinus CBS 121060]RAH69838.1 HHE domain protein [Aspergillus aculeatinus CBS 121060]
MTLISDAIKSDHRDLEEAYNNILTAASDDEKRRWQNQFTWELARHSIGEELVLYPAMEEHLTDGKAMADKDRAEHKTVKDHLEKFQNLKPDDAEFIPTLQGLWGSLSQHIKEEEEQDLVKLEANLDNEVSKAMVSSFKRTKMFVPTRSHPSAPDKPPFETVAGLLAAPIDHIRDLFRKFPDQAASDIPP